MRAIPWTHARALLDREVRHIENSLFKACLQMGHMSGFQPDKCFQQVTSRLCQSLPDCHLRDAGSQEGAGACVNSFLAVR